MQTALGVGRRKGFNRVGPCQSTAFSRADSVPKVRLAEGKEKPESCNVRLGAHWCI